MTVAFDPSYLVDALSSFDAQACASICSARDSGRCSAARTRSTARRSRVTATC